MGALKWDGTVTAGNALTAVAMLISLVVWGLRLETRVDGQERRVARLEQARDRDDAETVRLREMLARMDASIAAQLASQQRIERAIETLTAARAAR